MTSARSDLLRLVVILGSALTFACGAPTVPEPARASNDQLQEEPRAVDVTHPPPAALPEIVPDAPSVSAVWVDGQWAWQGRTWLWRRGGWVEPGNLRLVPSRVVYDKTGTLSFERAIWIDPEGRRVRPPPIVLPAASPPSPTLAEEATTP